MKKVLFISCFSLIFLFAGRAGAEPAGAENTVWLGSAKVEITPAVGTPLAGFGKRRGKPSTGVHDPLYARALALTRGGKTIVFVSADLVLIDEELRGEVLKKIRQTSPLGNESLILFATHTHSGAGAIGGRFWERFIMGKFRRPVFEKVTDGIAQAALAALAKKIPVEAEHSEMPIEEWIENRMDERLPGAHKLRVLQFRSLEDKKVAGQLVFMDAHPTLLPASNYEFSADFPGVLTGELEAGNDGAVALFANGASADLRPRLGDLGTEDRFKNMETYGKLMAGKIAGAHFESFDLSGPWEARIERVKLPRVKIRAGFLKIPSLLGGRFFPESTWFQALRLGNALILALPAEIASETGSEIAALARAHAFNPFLIGYANDYIAYVIPRRYYKDKSQYESQASFYGPKMDWFLQQKTSDLIRALEGEDPPEQKKPGKLSYQDGLAVLELKGDAYQVGFEEGRLLKNEIRAGIDSIFRYFKRELPVPVLNTLLIHFSLDRAWHKMEPYVSYEEYLQMKGISDGAGISFKKIRRLHAMPEVYPTWCANGAYWGKATQGGRLVAIRNLDWNRKIKVHDRAAVKWIETPGRRAYANIGYYGFTGVLSGLNESGISVGQIGAVSKDETMKGVPMPFLLKRVLSRAGNLEEAGALLMDSKRTRGYNYLITDAATQRARIFETTKNHVAAFSDNDPAEKIIPYAMSVENAVFRGDPALDPVIRNLQKASGGKPRKPGIEPPAGSAYEIRYLKHGELILKHYGQITPETAMGIAREIAPGSNIQSIIYAFPEFWVANAKDDLRAVDRPYTRFSVQDFKRGQDAA